jgi:hypothetical protein
LISLGPIKGLRKLIVDYRQTIQSLKITRKYQRISSERFFEMSRPPEGTALEYLFVRLMEMFHIEDFEDLKEGLIRLLPDLQGEIPMEDFRAQFDETADRSFGSWRTLGFIVRTSASNPMLKPCRVMPELPKEVKVIAVELHQVLPSFFVVTADCILGPEATSQLLALRDQPYLGQVRFDRLVPWGVFGVGRSQGNPNSEQERIIINWLAELRGKIETCLDPFISGYFMRQGGKRQTAQETRLPAIEVFALKGVPTDSVGAFEKWKEIAWHWWDSLAFNFSSNVYRTRELVFAYPRDRRGHESKVLGTTAYRMAALWEAFLATIDMEDYRDQSTEVFTSLQKDFARQEIVEKLNGILPLVVIPELLERIRDNVNRFKQAAFTSMTYGRHLRRYITLSYLVQREETLLNRVALEFEHNDGLMLLSMDSNFINEEETERRKRAGTQSTEPKAKNETKGDAPKTIWLKLIGWIDQLGSESRAEPDLEETKTDQSDSSLRTDGLRSIEYRIKNLKTQLAYIIRSFETHLKTRNMEVNYQLQPRVFWFTVIVTIATIAGVAATIIFGVLTILSKTSDLPRP